jgi:hypothetical protein
MKSWWARNRPDLESVVILAVLGLLLTLAVLVVSVRGFLV